MIIKTFEAFNPIFKGDDDATIEGILYKLENSKDIPEITYNRDGYGDSNYQFIIDEFNVSVKCSEGWGRIGSIPMPSSDSGHDYDIKIDGIDLNVRFKLAKRFYKYIKSLYDKPAKENSDYIKKDAMNHFRKKNEKITIPVKKGDTILMGRFKNKKTLVKKISKDEWGMPTINGKKVVTFRTFKKK